MQSTGGKRHLIVRKCFQIHPLTSLVTHQTANLLHSWPAWLQGQTFATTAILSGTTVRLSTGQITPVIICFSVLKTSIHSMCCIMCLYYSYPHSVGTCPHSMGTCPHSVGTCPHSVGHSVGHMSPRCVDMSTVSGHVPTLSTQCGDS